MFTKIKKYWRGCRNQDSSEKGIDNIGSYSKGKNCNFLMLSLYCSLSLVFILDKQTCPVQVS